VENCSKVDFPFTKKIGALPMRRSQTLIDQDGLWFQENDGTKKYVSMKRIGKSDAGVSRALFRVSLFEHLRLRHQ